MRFNEFRARLEQRYGERCGFLNRTQNGTFYEYTFRTETEEGVVTEFPDPVSTYLDGELCPGETEKVWGFMGHPADFPMLEEMDLTTEGFANALRHAGLAVHVEELDKRVVISAYTANNVCVATGEFSGHLGRSGGLRPPKYQDLITAVANKVAFEQRSSPTASESRSGKMDPQRIAEASKALNAAKKPEWPSTPADALEARIDAVSTAITGDKSNTVSYEHFKKAIGPVVTARPGARGGPRLGQEVLFETDAFSTADVRYHIVLRAGATEKHLFVYGKEGEERVRFSGVRDTIEMMKEAVKGEMLAPGRKPPTNEEIEKAVGGWVAGFLDSLFSQDGGGRGGPNEDRAEFDRFQEAADADERENADDERGR
jgi:hypothetical protein